MILCDRLLQLKLTDGKTMCRAIEHKPCPALDIKHLLPGTKVRLDGTVSIRLGIIMLDARSIQAGPPTPAVQLPGRLGLRLG